MDEKMKYQAVEIEIGSHSAGYRIDKTVSVINRYTKWDVNSLGEWTNPQPVCFHSLPIDGWEKQDVIDWSDVE